MSGHVPDMMIMCITSFGQRCDAGTIHDLHLHLPTTPSFLSTLFPPPTFPIPIPGLTPYPLCQHADLISTSHLEHSGPSPHPIVTLCTAKLLIHSFFCSTLSQDPNSDRQTPESNTSPLCSTSLGTHTSFHLHRQGFKSLCCTF